MRHGVESIHNHTHIHNNIDFFSKKHIHNNIDFFSKKHIHNNIDFFSKKHIHNPFQCLCMLIALLKFTSGTHMGMNNPPVVLFLDLSDTFFFWTFFCPVVATYECINQLYSTCVYLDGTQTDPLLLTLKICCTTD